MSIFIASFRIIIAISGVILTPVGLLLLPVKASEIFFAQATSTQKTQPDGLNENGQKALGQAQYKIELDKLQRRLLIFKQFPFHAMGGKTPNNTRAIRAMEGKTLNNIGAIYDSLGQYLNALATYEKALLISQEIAYRELEGKTLNNIGGVYNSLGQYPQALATYQQSLAISQEIGDHSLEGRTLNNIGEVYRNLSQYPKALATYEKALLISQDIDDRTLEGTTLNNIGLFYDSFGQYSKALVTYQQSLAVSEGIDNRTLKGITLNNIGAIYDSLGQYPQALAIYQQSLAISTEIGDRLGEGRTLNNTGKVYFHLRQYWKALAIYQQSLEITQDIGARALEGKTLDNIGAVYNSLGQYWKALATYQQSLAISKEIGDRALEGRTLYNIGYSYKMLKQPESAISFMKQSVNAYEAIRKDNLALSREKRESYTKTVESTYRKLTDMLLSQGRLLEAQEVLELLKIQEIYSLDRENRATLTTAGIEYTPIEKEIQKQHGNLIALGEQLYTCETQSSCSETQKGQLKTQREALQQQFDQTLTNAEEKAKSRIRQNTIVGKADFIKSYQSLVEAQPGTILVYPFITEETTWILWAGTGGILNSTEVPNVGRDQFLKEIQDFRSYLQVKSTVPVDLAKLQQSGQQLYQWLIKPLEPALVSKNIKNLIFSLDGTTRYIPIGALIGPDKKYLIEHYAISTVLNASVTDTSDQLPKSPQLSSVLGLGVSLSFLPEFEALKNVEPELKTIVKAPGDPTGLYPGEKFLNVDFNQQTLADRLKGQNILHIATHAKFLSTDPKASYLLLGNGEKYSIRDIQYLRNLGKVHLVVLSACETGLGETDSDGKEILGIGAYFTGSPSKAKAVLASLWKVNDTSTSGLMQSFYQNLSKGTMTKSEALRQAQLSMIKNTSPQNFSHPYYWAPFILIGNGL